MLIFLPLQLFIKCPEYFCISNASIYFRSSWLPMFACIMFQVIGGNLRLLWDAKCLYTVCFSIVKCSFILDPIVRPVSPMYTVPHAEHIILYTTFFFKQRFGLDDILHVSHSLGQFCFTLGGPKTFDKGWRFTKCIFTFCMRDRFSTPKAFRLNSSLINGNFK